MKEKTRDVLCLLAMLIACLSAAGLWVFSVQTQPSRPVMQYPQRLFDDSRVHHIDLQTGDWQQLLQQAQEEEYIPCTVVIDGEEFLQVAVRAKGNNSLRLTQQYGLSRYSLKLEFDHYLEGGHYYGLDKFSLDAFFQDNSAMKTKLTMDLMSWMGVPTPLCSYVWVTINGEDWGLFLAIEEPEESFLRRVYGDEEVHLYKPDYRSLQADNADVALQYLGDDPQNYPNIFDHAKTMASEADQRRLIQALKILDSGEHLEQAIDVDEVLRYFAVQVFVMNWDSYLGPTGHNYFLAEKDGLLSMIPWDYNLAFGTYALGMSEPIRDPEVLINYPVNTPAEGHIMKNRPLYHHLMKNDTYFARYHQLLRQLIEERIDQGWLTGRIAQLEQMILPYIQKDPTFFCSVEDHQQAVRVLEEVCRLRAASIRAQLDGTIPATLQGRQAYPQKVIEVSSLRLEDLGDFEDLRASRKKQEEALRRILKQEEQ